MNNAQNTNNKPADKIWADGTSVKARAGNYGPIIGMGINVDKFIAFLNKHKNEKGYVNINIMERKQVGTYGETHNCSLDTFVPKPRTDSTKQPESNNPVF